MSCRKFEAPRHGSLAFVPKCRTRSVRPTITAFEKDDPTQPVHLTAFMGYKAGMTHVIRSKTCQIKKTVSTVEVLEAVTVIETPPVVVFGVVGYTYTPKGLLRTKVAHSSHVNESVLRRFYKKFYTSKKKMFKSANKQDTKDLDIAELKKCDLIRVAVHTQTEKIKNIKMKKAHIAEVQVNGGSISDKVDWAMNILEKEIKVSDVFKTEEMIDTIAVTKGKGFQGVHKRFGTRILPRKTNKGCRKVACIGAWHPANVLYTVARAGQLGFFRRTEFNKAIYKMGNGKEEIKTDFDLTSKGINPMGGFPHYGFVNNDFLMLKGCVTGPRKRVVMLRKSCFGKRVAKNIQLKFIDTSSKIGTGRFQTVEEKANFYGNKKRKIIQDEN